MKENPFPGTVNLERWESPIRKTLNGLKKQRVLERIVAGDWTVWKKEDREISNRLGWLDPLPRAATELAGIDAFVREVREDGLSRILLLGMGGSSLAPEVFGRLFRTRKGFPALDILDTTSPDAVGRAGRGLDPAKTLFIVSSKSGTTVETTSLFNYFYALTRDRLGAVRAGSRFTAITDPGTPLESLARRLGFRRVFSGDPAVGGRFSALTVFGLVPAALKGIEIGRILAGSERTIQACRSGDPEANPAAFLGTVLGVMAGRGIDKATFLVSPRVRSLSAWLEQLIAESTGKEGGGILPVPEDAPAEPHSYGRDRLFIHIRCGEDGSLDQGIGRLRKSGFPIVSMTMKDVTSLPGHFFLWEMATAVAGYILGTNPFDQPDVESTKKKTKEALGTEGQAGRGRRDETRENLRDFLSGASGGDYVAIQAFLDPVPAIGRALNNLKDKIRERTGLPVTLGFGPRYLHSTGQLHKGDAGRGLFIQLTSEAKSDVPIPDVDGVRPASSFGALFSAQAWGDRMALREGGRRVIRIDLGKDSRTGLRRLLRN
jgi:glucose-6-phosphate isomerase